jgi:hypothetical protein
MSLSLFQSVAITAIPSYVTAMFVTGKDVGALAMKGKTVSKGQLSKWDHNKKDESIIYDALLGDAFVGSVIGMLSIPFVARDDSWMSFALVAAVSVAATYWIAPMFFTVDKKKGTETLKEGGYFGSYI